MGNVRVLQLILIAFFLVSTVLPSPKMLGVGGEARELTHRVNSRSLAPQQCPDSCSSDHECVEANCGYRCLRISPVKRLCSDI
ncbi:hypothetical protein ABFS83_13G013200 [Erythranthe nasuta]